MTFTDQFDYHGGRAMRLKVWSKAMLGDSVTLESGVLYMWRNVGPHSLRSFYSIEADTRSVMLRAQQISPAWEMSPPERP